MIMATLFVTLPFMIRELIPVLENFKIEQEQAAATLGAKGWQIFLRVTLPALRWGFIYGITLTFARALGEFGAVLVIGGGIQGITETATLFIYRNLDERIYTAAYSAALVLGLVSFLIVMGTELLRKMEQHKSET
jgi:sulfate/thiosulfate transport system permease protein